MSNFAKVSKSGLIDFARLIYKQALNGYCDLEDSVCIGETNRFFNSLEKDFSISVASSTSNMTFISSNPQNSQYFVGFDPSFSCTVGQTNYTIGEANPTEQQLLLFNGADSSGNTINEVIGNDEEILVDSNEGHVFHNF
jgi:hypothetical protein